MILVSLLLALTINCGSPTDTQSCAPTSISSCYTAPDGSTMRVGYKFSYSIQTSGPQILTLSFNESTVSTAGQRIFSVQVNNQVVLDKIDLFSEGKKLTRSMLVVPSDGVIKITFIAQTRTAIISQIKLSPLSLGPTLPPLPQSLTRTPVRIQ